MAEDVREERGPRATPTAGATRRSRPRRLTGWTAGLAALMVGALAVRLWGVGHGLPYAYNADENAHFVPKAIGLFGHDANPHYFVNPPAFTYVLHAVFAVWFGGRQGVSDAYAGHPEEVFAVARVTAAVLGSVAVGLLAAAGARLFDRRVGMLGAGLLAVAFLPVFYAKLALNDAPTLAPVCLALWAVAGVVRFGRSRDYAVAGLALGLAAATKYTGGIVLVPLLGAAAVRWATPGGRRTATRGLALAGALALAGFLAANPYAVLSPAELLDGLSHQNDASGGGDGKLGLTQVNGVLYYLWTLTWGLGCIPAVASLAAVGWLWRAQRSLVWVLVPGPVLFGLFMGLQGRFYGRWLLPVLPILCLLAAYVALELAERGARRRPWLRPALVALAVVALCGQAAVAVVHSGRVLSREDTRNETRAWMVDNVPATQLTRDLGTGQMRNGATRIAVEPVVPDGWAQDIGRPSPLTANGNRWVKFPTARSNVADDGSQVPGPGRIVNIEDYERTLQPELIDTYERQGYCWVVTGSTQRGRAEAEPRAVPRALAYYAELQRRAELVHVASPYRAGEGPVAFNFDWSFDYYPKAYDRPGPLMKVYRLRGGQCAR